LPTRSWSWPSLHRGGLRHGVQKFGGRPDPHDVDSALLAVAAIAIPTIASAPGGPDRGHETEISVVVSLVLLVVFTASIPFSIGKAGPDVGAEEGTVLSDRLWPIGLALVILAAAGIGAAFVSDWFVDALTAAMDTSGCPSRSPVWSSSPIAGNAVENVVGVQPCSPTGATSPSASS